MRRKFNMNIVKPKGVARSSKVKLKGTELTSGDTIHVTPSDAKATQDLGGGFFRFTYSYEMAPYTWRSVTFLGGSYKPVSGGWWVSENTSQLVYATTNYSTSDYTWDIVLQNLTDLNRSVVFVFIAKL